MRMMYPLKTPTEKITPGSRNFYEIPVESKGRYWYSDNPKAQANKTALLAFNRFATENSIAFVVVLIPPKEEATDTGWYEEIRKFLAENAITYIDLTFSFRERALTARDLYWKYDGHINPLGNKVVAEVLIDKFPRIFEKRRPAK